MSPKIAPTQHDAERLPEAHSLREAANSGNTLEGYAAMNDVDENSEIAQAAVQNPVDFHEQVRILAYHLYLERGGENGSAADDWCKAEEQIRSRGELEK